MCKQLQITICIFLIQYFQNVALSYKIYNLDSEAKSYLLPKIRQIIQDQRLQELDTYKTGYENTEDVRKEKKNQLYKPMGKSIFVKRIIPHGYTTGAYEYDSKLNSVFKPLFRYHVKNPLDNEETKFREIKRNQVLRDDFEDGLIVLVKKDRRDPQNFLQQIQKYLNKNLNERKRKKKRFKGISSRLEKDTLKLLRTIGKSGEKHDPYGPGKLPSYVETNTTSKNGPKFVYPNYPFYNYWTYQKNIIQDKCPGNLIQMGNVCMGSIGHRSFSKPFKNPISFSNGRRSMTRRSHSKKNKKKHEESRSMRAARKRHLYKYKK